MAFASLGAIVGDVVAPVQSYTAGVRVLGPVTVPKDYSSILILNDLRQVDSLTATIHCTMDYSIDGGATWVFAGGGGVDLAKSGYTLVGGKLTNQEGGLVRIRGTRYDIHRTDLVRQVRATFTTNETLIVGVTVVAW